MSSAPFLLPPPVSHVSPLPFLTDRLQRFRERAWRELLEAAHRGEEPEWARLLTELEARDLWRAGVDPSVQLLAECCVLEHHGAGLDGGILGAGRERGSRLRAILLARLRTADPGWDSRVRRALSGPCCAHDSSLRPWREGLWLAWRAVTADRRDARSGGGTGQDGSCLSSASRGGGVGWPSVVGSG